MRGMASLSLVVICTQQPQPAPPASSLPHQWLTSLMVLSSVAFSSNPRMHNGHLWLECSFSRDLRKKDCEPFTVEMFLGGEWEWEGEEWREGIGSGGVGEWERRGGRLRIELHMGQSKVGPYSVAESIFCCKVSTMT